MAERAELNAHFECQWKWGSKPHPLSNYAIKSTNSKYRKMNMATRAVTMVPDDNYHQYMFTRIYYSINTFIRNLKMMHSLVENVHQKCYYNSLRSQKVFKSNQFGAFTWNKHINILKSWYVIFLNYISQKLLDRFELC